MFLVCFGLSVVITGRGHSQGLSCIENPWEVAEEVSAISKNPEPDFSNPSKGISGHFLQRLAALFAERQTI